eukprot:2998318-Rhodomonas_salina.2
MSVPQPSAIVHSVPEKHVSFRRRRRLPPCLSPAQSRSNPETEIERGRGNNEGRVVCCAHATGQHIVQCSVRYSAVYYAGRSTAVSSRIIVRSL